MAPLTSRASSGAPGVFGPQQSRADMQQEAERYVRRAIGMIDRARALVIGDRRDTLALLTRRRATLGQHFQRYQQFKHGRIFDPVVQHGTASAQVVARTMKVDCLQLGNMFTAYHTRWLGMRPQEWALYRDDMLEVTAMLTESLTAEARAIRQLLMISAFYAD